MALNSPTLKAELIAKARVQVLYEVVEEVIKAFALSFEGVVARVLRQGVLENQYFEAVHVYFLNTSGERVGEATLKIDWETHRVELAKQGEFRIEAGKSIGHQICELIPIIIEHVQKMKQVLGVVRTEVWFTWKGDLAREPARLLEAQSALGFVTDKAKQQQPPKWSKSASENAPDDFVFEICGEGLRELKISVRHNP